jgi:lipopolysaccharide biosynthesis glycosyltransferase
MNLVYYTVGGDRKYVEMLKLSIESLRTKSNMTNTHVMVMCDKEYVEHLKDVEGIDDVMIVQKGKNAMEISLQKINIMDYGKIDAYNKVLFLDCDIIVNRDIITNYLDTLDEIGKTFDANEYRNKLHVCVEHTDVCYHNRPWFGFQNYKKSQLALFHIKRQWVFNCGQFAFFVNDKIKRHFRAVQEMYARHRGPYYYEQSFMNFYFNPRFLTISSLTTFVCMPLYDNVTRNNVNPYLTHYAGGSESFEYKLDCMKQQD